VTETKDSNNGWIVILGRFGRGGLKEIGELEALIKWKEPLLCRWGTKRSQGRVFRANACSRFVKTDYANLQAPDGHVVTSLAKYIIVILG
jgi:hypothetical protein